ncbi:MAG: aminotransferase class V-fold PLP-dependent enzyme [Anaerolineaceae bacterium]|nr:aminotransferase class V-fold PLP-dependent enzyme [Anaerolineaceae bacterium]
MISMKDEFLLDPDIIFLNHGSFGAVPKGVFEVYQDWQRQLERQPVKFLARDMLPNFEKARIVLGDYLSVISQNLVFISNATFGVNILARSMKLSKTDEILTTDHEYGACDNCWQFICQKTGAQLVRQPIPLPIQSFEQMADQFWQGVTPRTKIIFISHITSSTAVIFPVEEICRRARKAGILTIIDGAHAPGQIPLNLGDLGADYYVGNCHKWMLAPKGVGFLYAHPAVQHLVEPLVVSWGWGENSPFDSGSDFLNYLEWSGTNDPAAALTVPAAIHYLEEKNWPNVRRGCNAILKKAIRQISELTGLPAIYPTESGYYHQMAVVALPLLNNLEEFQAQLYERYKIEVPCIEWNGRHFIRISIQAYNTENNIDRLVSALQEMLPEFSI